MDFLDPRKTRAKKIRLTIGYALMAFVIIVGTLILVYGAYGYNVDTKTGQIVQNGLLFLDSKPSGASIYLNDKPVGNTTSARLVLPAGDYKITLKKDGYRDWERHAVLEEHSIDRFVYPFLFPKEPLTSVMKVYGAMPPLMSESPDRHWLLVQRPNISQSVSFDEYDTGDLTKPNDVVTIPSSLLTNASLPGSSFTEVEWSSDNNHLLLRHNYQGGNEFIILDRSNPSESVNVNKLFGVNPSQVALKNKKTSQLYIYDAAARTLQVGDTDKSTLVAPFLRHVLAFKPYGNNTVTYVTDNDTPAGEVAARIWDSGKNYRLSTFSSGSQYVVNAASFQGHLYFVAGSNTSELFNFYKDPLDSLKDPAIGKAVPLLTLRVPGGTSGTFSNNARFIVVQGGQNFAVYDMETKMRYQYSLKTPLAAPLHWMDGHRLIGASNGSIFVMDYDSTNQQTLTPTAYPLGGYFSRNYNQLFTLAPVAGSSSAALQRIDMRAGSDLPKNP